MIVFAGIEVNRFIRASMDPKIDHLISIDFCASDPHGSIDRRFEDTRSNITPIDGYVRSFANVDRKYAPHFLVLYPRKPIATNR
jgi:hypothetical protein